MERCGFAPVLLPGPPSQLATQVRSVLPQLLVLDLASGGIRGLGIVQTVRYAAPACAVVLLSPFEGLRTAALEAGAYELAGKDDLRDLERCLRRLKAELDARDSAGLRVQPVVGVQTASQWQGEQKSVAVVGEISAVAPGKTAGDWETKARTTFAVQADEAFEDVIDGFLGDP